MSAPITATEIEARLKEKRLDAREYWQRLVERAANPPIVVNKDGSIEELATRNLAKTMRDELIGRSFPFH